MEEQDKGEVEEQAFRIKREDEGADADSEVEEQMFRGRGREDEGDEENSGEDEDGSEVEEQAARFRI